MVKNEDLFFRFHFIDAAFEFNRHFPTEIKIFSKELLGFSPGSSLGSQTVVQIRFEFVAVYLSIHTPNRIRHLRLVRMQLKALFNLR